MLGRRLLLDLSLADRGRDRRDEACEEEEQFLEYRYLVPFSRRPQPIRIQRVLEAFESDGFKLADSAKQYVVYPAGIGAEELRFATLAGASLLLSNEGGGMLMHGFGAGIAFGCDPRAQSRWQVISRANLDDELCFGEYSVMMPCPDPEGITYEDASTALLRTMSAIESELEPEFGFSLTTADQGTIMLRWPCHREILHRAAPSEVFWYQYLSEYISHEAVLDEYRRLGCQVENRAGGGYVARLAATPLEGLQFIARARATWIFSVTPKTVM